MRYQKISVRSSALRHRRVYGAITESGPTNSPWKHGPNAQTIRSNTANIAMRVGLGTLLRVISPTRLVGLRHDSGWVISACLGFGGRMIALLRVL